MINLSKRNQNIEKEKIGIYAFLAFATLSSIIFYSINWLNLFPHENLASAFSLSTHFNEIAHQPYRLITTHFLIQDWSEALLCIITVQLVIRQKDEILPSKFIGAIIVFQLLQSLFTIFLLRALEIEPIPHASILPTLLAILLLANWRNFNENYLRIPFTSKHLPFNLLWLSIILATMLFSFLSGRPAQAISIISTGICAYIIGISFYYFHKKTHSTELENYTQLEFKTPINLTNTTQAHHGSTKKEQLDLILDKISHFGINSLTYSERTFLDSYAQESNNNNR